MEVRSVGVFLLVIFVTPLLSPTVIADWDDDNWLWNLIGPERLEHGDEFACHGYEGKDINNDNNIIKSCKNYLTEHTNSSRWGVEPISFGVPEIITNDTVYSLKESGFLIIGDNLKTETDDFFVIQRNGGSLEKNAANISLLESAEKDSLISIYWEARIFDLKVREDKTAIELLENQNVWYTTWGEWYSHNLSSSRILVNSSNNTINLQLPVDFDSSWIVPGSLIINTETPISSIQYLNGENFPLLSEDSKSLKEGWRLVDEGIILSIYPGNEVVLNFEHNLSYTYNPLKTFNDLHHSVTIVGHHVKNLHEWASDFYDSPLIFTWLIERPLALEMNWRLPIIAVAILIATPLTIKWLVARDKNLREL
tara:strand:- start:7210 stop:8310 length:1101 start_codon:yes stop_codon:yes gene_type:complete